MKNFLTFTLAAGVAITGAQVAQAAGVNKAVDRTVKTQTQLPGSTATASSVGFDQFAMNRELSRISGMLSPIGALSDDGLLEDGAVAVGKKVGGYFTY